MVSGSLEVVVKNFALIVKEVYYWLQIGLGLHERVEQIVVVIYFGSTKAHQVGGKETRQSTTVKTKKRGRKTQRPSDLHSPAS